MVRAAASAPLESVVEGVRVGCVMHVGGEGPKAELVGHRLEGHRHREVGAPVVGVVEHADPGPTGVLSRDLDGVLDGLGAGVEQHALLGEVAGGVLGEQFGHAHVRLVGRDREHRVGELGELRLAAATTASSVWPMVMTPMPEPRSMNWLPSTSTTMAPWARSMKTGSAMDRRRRRPRGVVSAGRPTSDREWR